MKSTANQEKEIEDRVSPPGEVVYEAIYREGEHELKRSNAALALSGLAAGLSMGFSFLAEGLLRSCLPDAHWLPAITKLGYAIGFVIVILGRQQLFSKNTLTVILPLLNRRRSRASSGIGNVARLWAIILAANLCGATIFAALVSWPGLFPSQVRSAFSEIGRQAMEASFLVMLVRGLLAGWLIALMIWLLPFAETARVTVITMLAYVVGLGHLPHVIAGTVDVMYAVFTGQCGLARFLGGFLVPAFLGNALGGVALVAVGAHAEFVEEGPAKGK